MPQYAIRASSQAPFDAVLARTEQALADEGFGIMSRIDVQAKIQEKLGKELGPYVILGACIPAMAWEGLSAVPDLGVFLPCNVCVYGQDPVTVAAMDPLAVLPLVEEPRIDRLGADVRQRLRRAVEGAAQEVAA